MKTLVIYAAASLKDAFEELSKGFEKEHPGVTVIFSFAGSQLLRTQLEQGAIADLYASADPANMDLLVQENLIDRNHQAIIATNHLVVILPHSNPAKVNTLSDLSKTGLKLVLADASVPAGNYARQVLYKMDKYPEFGKDYSIRVLHNAVSNETDVKQVVTKVQLGEADAGIVYVSDAIAASGLVTLTIPDKFNITAQYPIGILRSSTNKELSAAFIAYLESDAGQLILSKWGFLPGL
jgi:molybdate transport system substrate-binding protein